MVVGAEGFMGRGARALTGFVVALMVAALSGCAGYAVKGDALTQSLATGNVRAGVAQLDGNDPKADRDLLYYLEKGELLRAAGDYRASLDTWLVAEEKVEAWEDLAQHDPSKLMGDVGAYLVNDSVRRYDCRDYEKVFLNVRLALDHLGMNDFDDARVQIKKMHEREAIIADFRARELDQAKKDAAAKGVKVTSFKELNGYPIETLEAPEVVSLKNSYESAFANYLAGFIYESLGETSLAAPGYRKAAEMRPDNPAIEEALAGLEARIRNRKANTVDTLFVIESGLAPAVRSVQLPINLPILTKNGLSYVMTAVSWPVVYPGNPAIVPSSIIVDDKTLPVSLLTDTSAMARRAISDEMPGIIARSTIRAITRAVAQKSIDDNTKNTGLAGAMMSLAAKVVSVVTEHADERAWRTLPGYFSVARAALAPGKHMMTIQTAAGPKNIEFTVTGRHALIGVRTISDTLYVAQPVDPSADAQSGTAAGSQPPQSDAASAANVASK